MPCTITPRAVAPGRAFGPAGAPLQGRHQATIAVQTVALGVACAEAQLHILGSVLERNGEFKLFSYVVD